MAGRTVLVVLVAVALGLLILRNGFSDTGGGSGAAPTTTAPTATTTTVAPTTTTIDKASFQVIVANAAGVSGSAKRTSDALAALGFSLLPPTNASVTGQAQTKVYYQPGSEAAAAAVAEALGVPVTGALPQPSPVANIGDADVVVVLGRDIAIGGLPAATTTAPSAPTTVGG